MKNKNKEEVIDVKVEENNNLPVVSQDRIDTDTIIANIDAQAKIFERLQEYVKDNLKPKVDYYSIKKKAKPSLGKSGAEKIDFIFNLVPRYVILSKTSTSAEIAYELRCDLYNKNSDKFMGSGVGYCSSKEDKMQKSMTKQGIKNVESIGNNVFKICKKRSYVDATLSSTMASFIFTQDLEDGYLGTDDEGKGNKTTNRTDKKTDDVKENLQKLDPTEFKVPFRKSKYMGMVLTDCPKWWLEGQLKYVEAGKLIPSKYGYDNEEYKNMFRKAIEIKEQQKDEDNKVTDDFEESEGKLKV